jgi:hypothetical protein
MTREDLQIIQAAHDKLEQLEHSGRFADADAFFERNRYTFNFDRNGNWVGEVANENGWTP